MSTTKAIIDYSNYTALELGPIAQRIHDGMAGHPTVFPDPDPVLTELQTLITTYNQKLTARRSRATADVIAFNNARDALEDAMSTEATYVNKVAKGDMAIVEMSGCIFYETGHSIDTSPPGAPTNLRLKPGDLSGTVVARYTSERPSSSHEVQVATGDPSVAANWHTVGIFQSQKAIITGLTPATMIWVRVRTVGLKGVMGEWSDPAQIVVQ